MARTRGSEERRLKAEMRDRAISWVKPLWAAGRWSLMMMTGVTAEEEAGWWEKRRVGRVKVL